ncbi:MAG: hypothetical protein ABR504_13285 [Paracoccaceae bacterium]
MAALSLPDFGERDVETAYDETRLPGYAAGFAAAKVAAEAAQAALAADLVQSIQDHQFGFAEAQRALFMQLEPLFQAIVEQVLPVLVDAAFAERVTAMLTDATKTHLDTPLVLQVHPSQIPGVSAVLSRHPIDVTVTPDPDCAPHAAKLGTGTGAINLDLSRLVTEIGQLCDDFFSLANERTAHG